ncbi:MAG: GNAT family N-acetyltransferase [Lewinellaceae bacterium]|nr:GNAT family N-acetyltransferase [Saprospiraceae bacterium]MCB9339144.1 GNAT family N-acetyltransferase [Lewinellaceae bacterium]
MEKKADRPRNQFVLETRRLWFRELSVADAEDFYRLNADVEVIRYTGDKPFLSIGEARIFLENYDQYEKYGYGRWAVLLKGTGKFIGWCGFKFSPESQETDLGFRFFRKYWGHGYATEAAIACIDFGFNSLGLTTLVGKAMKENSASIRVLEKSGMRFIKEISFDGSAGLFFSIQKAAV